MLLTGPCNIKSVSLHIAVKRGDTIDAFLLWKSDVKCVHNFWFRF